MKDKMIKVNICCDCEESISKGNAAKINLQTVVEGDFKGIRFRCLECGDEYFLKDCGGKLF